MEDPALVLAPRPSANTGDLKSPASAPRIVYKELRGSNLPFHRAIRRHKSARKPQLMPPTGSLSLSFGKIHVLGRRSAVGKSLGGLSGTGAVRKDASTKRRNSKDETDYVKKTRFPTKRPAQFGGRNFQNVLQGGGSTRLPLHGTQNFNPYSKLTPVSCFALSSLLVFLLLYFNNKQ